MLKGMKIPGKLNKNRSLEGILPLLASIPSEIFTIPTEIFHWIFVWDFFKYLQWDNKYLTEDIDQLSKFYFVSFSV